MKISPLVWVVLAGALLAWIAIRSPERDYQPLDPETELSTGVPARLSGVVPAGFVVRDFDVDGMCCNGCAGKLAGRLGEVEGVNETAVDVELGRVSVVAAESLAVEGLLALLNVEKYSASLRN